MMLVECRLASCRHSGWLVGMIVGIALSCGDFLMWFACWALCGAFSIKCSVLTFCALAVLSTCGVVFFRVSVVRHTCDLGILWCCLIGRILCVTGSVIHNLFA